MKPNSGPVPKPQFVPYPDTDREVPFAAVNIKLRGCRLVELGDTARKGYCYPVAMITNYFLYLNNAPEPTVQLDYMPTILPNVGDGVFDQTGHVHKVSSRAFHIGKDIFEIYIYADEIASAHR